MDITVPRLDDSIRLRDGRRLAFAEWGHSKGRPLLFLHGVPGSRRWLDDPANAARQVRLITVDRPGYGGSEVKAHASLESWAADVGELADALRIDTFPIASWSQGGPYALACAAWLGDRVSRVGLISNSHVPLDQVPEAYDALAPEEKDEVVKARQAPERLMTQWLQDGRHEFFLNPDNVLHALARSDAWLAEDDVRRSMLASHIREAFRTGPEGMLWEEVAVLLPWGFNLSQIGRDVTLWRGNLETNPAPGMVAERIPRSRLLSWEGEGHVAFLRHWDDVVRELLP